MKLVFDDYSTQSLEWWKSKMPEGWRVLGWTFKLRCTAINDKTGKTVELDPDFIEAFESKFKKEAPCKLM